MKTAALSTLAMFALATTACSPGSIRGEVDGEDVPVFRSSVLFEASSLTPEDDYVTVVAFYTFSNACDVVAGEAEARAEGIDELFQSGNPDDLIDTVEDFQKENMPDDYWAAYVFIAADDEGEVQDDFDVEDDAATVVVCHHTGAIDIDRDEFASAAMPAFVAATQGSDASADCYIADEGEVRVSLFDENESIALVADTELVTTDGDADDAGEIRLGGVAAYCPQMDDANDENVDAMFDLLAALQE